MFFFALSFVLIQPWAVTYSKDAFEVK